MKNYLHHNKTWITATEAARYTGHEIHSFRRWAKNGVIKAIENPTKKSRSAWLYNREDIDREILHLI